MTCKRNQKYCHGLDWVVGLKANCPLVGPGTVGGVFSTGVFLKDPPRIYARFGETTENSERLGRQARPRIEPGIFRLPPSRLLVHPVY